MYSFGSLKRVIYTHCAFCYTACRDFESTFVANDNVRPSLVFLLTFRNSVCGSQQTKQCVFNVFKTAAISRLKWRLLF